MHWTDPCCRRGVDFRQGVFILAPHMLVAFLECNKNSSGRILQTLVAEFFLFLITVFGSHIKVDSMAKIADLEMAEKEKMKDKVNKIIINHKCNVLVSRQFIYYNYPERLFTDAGIMAIEHADFDGIERLALVTD